MSKQHRVGLDTPIGVLSIAGTDEGVQSILFSEEEQLPEPIRPDTPQALMECRLQLDQYFRGERRMFTFPCAAQGTEFQKRVWQALTDVPYAQTASYKDIAVAIGSERAIRAVGSANGRNKLSIVVPCHRIIGSSGALTGYAGGLWRKEWLLLHEKAVQSAEPGAAREKEPLP
ncbi:MULTISPECIES: methylated-DNA--[protein]-cysteine S-methyltransferase [unclassified Paenibacillus]|uniref:methylated-DNA--[protein]-cysteine S-methyltransferase n=1 Tax=unclassified Paenibacillus TaxID=185978 RepID=UPI0009562514|nr:MULTISPECIES: methylated-DNA--[protein]-cysteine S-methyltransferase [unclassified Paenibacillus]ASS67508.1 methylated-DNA--[protein]-cysteine S-methyltransferase [Paenibacillus sp. RUD330]SIQ74539.1 methylated-DNA-[protein]-cysteine S-methyltransferase [Paenibacillus sp. RU4X]SIQ95981.1 methylated-DNA-[protein]-cysteine S-methyltransferase [Paenibacillus sp. RU4T]